MKLITKPSAPEAWSISRLLLKLPPRQLGTAICVLIFGGSCIVLSYLYVHASSLQKAMLETMISELAESAAILVDMDRHEALTEPDQLGSSDYQATIAPLVRFHRNLPLAQYVYTMRVTNDDKLYFILDTATDADIAISQK